MPRRRWRCRVAAVALIVYVPVALDGCVSIKLAPRAAAEAADTAGSFRFLAVRKARDRGHADRATRAVLAALFRLEGGEEQVVWRAAGGDWTVRELPPGAYRLRVERVVDEHGNLEEPSGELSQEVTVRSGETVQANVVLQKTPWGLVVAVSVTVVFLVVLLAILAQGGDLDLPSADLSGLAPVVPPLSPEIVEAGLEFIELGALLDDDDDEDGADAAVDGVTPGDGEEGVDPHASVDVELSHAVDPLTVDQRTFGLFTGGRQLPSAIAVRGDGRRLHLVPLAPMPAGTEVTARLMGSHVALADDEPGTLQDNYEWRFRVASE